MVGSLCPTYEIRYFFLLKSGIKTVKVCSLLTNPPEMLKSAIKTAKVWQFVYVATKLPPCGSFYTRKTVQRLALLMALFKTALYWQVSPSVVVVVVNIAVHMVNKSLIGTF